MPGDHPLDDHQDPPVLVGEVAGAQAVETDDGDHLLGADDRHGDLPLDRLGDLPVEPPGALLLGGVGDEVGASRGGDVAGEAALLGRQFEAPHADGGDILLEPLLALGPDEAPVPLLHDEPALAVLLPHQGDAPRVGSDQLHGLGEDPPEKGLEPLDLFLKQVADLGQHLDLHVLAADLLDDPLGHLGVGLEQTLLEVVELVFLGGVVVDQADDPPGAGVEAGDDVEGLESQLLGEVALLQRHRRELGKEERLEQGVVGDDAGAVDVAGEEGLAGGKLHELLVFVDALDLLLLGVGGEHLEPLLPGAWSDGGGDEDRGELQPVDEPHRRFDHGEGGFLLLRLVDPPGQHDLLMVFTGLVDDGGDLGEKGLEVPPVVLVGELPLASAVEAEDTHGPSLVLQGEKVAGADAELLGELPGKGAGEGGHVGDQRLLLGAVDPGD